MSPEDPSILSVKQHDLLMKATLFANIRSRNPNESLPRSYASSSVPDHRPHSPSETFDCDVVQTWSPFHPSNLVDRVTRHGSSICGSILRWDTRVCQCDRWLGGGSLTHSHFATGSVCSSVLQADPSTHHGLAGRCAGGGGEKGS